MQNVSMKGAKRMLTVKFGRIYNNFDNFRLDLLLTVLLYMQDVNANANMKGAKRMLTEDFGGIYN